MSKLKVSDHSDAPMEGRGKQINFKHDYTEIDYVLALFQVEGKFYCMTDQCRCCSGSLGLGVLEGMFAFCHKDACGWNIRKGYCKFNRSDITPTYKVSVEKDGLFIEI